MAEDEVMEVVEEVQTSDAEIENSPMNVGDVRSESVIDLVKKDSEYEKEYRCICPGTAARTIDFRGIQ